MDDVSATFDSQKIVVGRIVNVSLTAEESVEATDLGNELFQDADLLNAVLPERLRHFLAARVFCVRDLLFSQNIGHQWIGVQVTQSD